MEAQINLQMAGDLDRKYFLAFLKGLSQIKFKDAYKKVREQKSLQYGNTGEEEDEDVDLGFLYQNLFDPHTTSPDEFNTLVENTLRVLSDIVANNFSKEELEQYLSRKVSAREDSQKAISLFWKQERANIVKAVRMATANDTEGIGEIDWQIHLTTAGRHQSKVNQQSATVVIQPQKGDQRDRIMFEVSKADVSLMLEKLSIVDQVVAQPQSQEQTGQE